MRFHTHGFENLYFHEQQDLAPPWLSLTQIHDAVVEPSFISNTGEIGQRAITLLRRDSVREYAFRIIEPKNNLGWKGPKVDESNPIQRAVTPFSPVFLGSYILYN